MGERVGVWGVWRNGGRGDCGRMSCSQKNNEKKERHQYYKEL